MMDFLAGFFFQLVTKDLHFEHFHPKNVSQTDGGHYSRLVTPDIKSRLLDLGLLSAIKQF